jgi:hypothetical protein
LMSGFRPFSLGDNASPVREANYSTNCQSSRSS